jgi:competence protein CoiA
MLIARLDGERAPAAMARRGLIYTCPNCDSVVILKQGRKVIWHFAHKPPVDCAWGTGETIHHLEAKKLICDAFIARGLRAELEYVVPELMGDRRADVMVWSPEGSQVAIELQHSSIPIGEIEARAASYARAGIAQVWIPFLPKKLSIKTDPNGRCLISRYSVRDFERWIHAFCAGRMWMYDPSAKKFWRGHFAEHTLYVEAKSWYDEDGQEQSVGGYAYASVRFRDLTIIGPYGVDDLRLTIKRHPPRLILGRAMSGHRLASFIVSGS